MTLLSDVSTFFSVNRLHGVIDFVESSPMLVRTGHSGDLIRPTVMKVTNSSRKEVEILRAIGTHFAPEILCVDNSYYVMSQLDSRRPKPDALIKIDRTLRHHVWTQPNLYDPLWANWRREFNDRFSFEPPEWVDEDPCLIHGDPTIANTLFNDFGRPFLIDPKPCGNGIPPFPSVDRGKILQSYAGWEVWLTNQRYPQFMTPFTEEEEELLVRRAVFWCAVHFLRIQQREGGTGLGIRAQFYADELFKMIEVNPNACL